MRVVKKPEERKAEMIEAAAKLFVTQGFVRTSVAEIVAAVDVAKGLFYYYFTTKDDMVKAVLEGFSAHAGACLETIAGSDLTGEEKLQAMLSCTMWKELAATPLFKDLCMPQHTALYADAVERITEHTVPAMTQVTIQVLSEAGRDTRYAEDMVRILCHGLMQLARRGEIDDAKANVLVRQMLGI